MSQLRLALIYSTENQCCNRLNKYIYVETSPLKSSTAVAKIIAIINVSTSVIFYLKKNKLKKKYLRRELQEFHIFFIRGICNQKYT